VVGKGKLGTNVQKIGNGIHIEKEEPKEKRIWL
jgi:hypothetical protein